ncbi:TPA: hypothetical protein DCZ39_06205 [Patescibacteria group bacterium]|nr:hypothetical protein [Candidatus Gracilibacteria bacterium]
MFEKKRELSIKRLQLFRFFLYTWGIIFICLLFVIMKKLLTLASLAATVVLFAGCLNKPTETDDTTTPTVETTVTTEEVVPAVEEVTPTVDTTVTTETTVTTDTGATAE